MGITRKLFLLAIVFAVLSIYSLHSRLESEPAVCKEYSLPTPAPLEGALAPNDALTKVEKLLEGQIRGPESILVHGDALYTGLADGRIVKIVNGQIVKEHRLRPTKEACDSYALESTCGRPLGIRRLSTGKLVVADAYLGVYEVDFEKGTHKLLLDAHKPIDGHIPKFINDLDVLNDDELIISDSSVRNQRRDFMKDILESTPSGRILHHKISTGATRVLVQSVHFANGVQLLPDKKSFIFSELTRARILRYHLEGAQKGKVTVWSDNLPGLPDNIRLSTNNTIWVGIGAIRKAGDSMERLSGLPKVREAIVKFLPDFVLRDVITKFAPKYGMVLQYDAQGALVSSLHDPTGAVIHAVSQVTDAGDRLYLGSFDAPFIASIKKF